MKEGWPWIEENLDKHDKTWVEGYNDDMDALLVFVSNTLRLVAFVELLRHVGN